MMNAKTVAPILRSIQSAMYERDQFGALDAMPPALRECVHDFGMSVVVAFVQVGIGSPRVIRHLIQSVRLGAREPGNRIPVGGPRRRGSGIETQIDTLLIGAGGICMGREIIAAIRHGGGSVLPIEPNEVGIAASLSALDNRGLVNRRQKHKLRLRAALRAMDAYTWEPPAGGE